MTDISKPWYAVMRGNFDIYDAPFPTEQAARRTCNQRKKEDPENSMWYRVARIEFMEEMASEEIPD